MPAKEVTFANLNDNIDSRFLEDMCLKFGELDECRIYYNPKNRKHLGIAKVVFQSQRSAKECCHYLNQTSKMGNVMNVFLDTMGLERSKMVEEIVNPNAALYNSNVVPPAAANTSAVPTSSSGNSQSIPKSNANATPPQPPPPPLPPADASLNVSKSPKQPTSR